MNKLQKKDKKYTRDKIDPVLQAIKIIREKHGREKPKKSIGDTMECPICKGILYYFVNSNNSRIWGKCETEKCLSWMIGFRLRDYEGSK